MTPQIQKPIRKGRFVVTTVQDPGMTTQPVAILVPTSPAAQPGDATAGQAELVYNPAAATAVVVSPSLMPQQVVYAAAPEPAALPPRPTDNPPTTIATGGVSAPLEVQREKLRHAAEQRPRYPAPMRRQNNEKGLGRVFYLLEQARQEVMEADRSSKGLQSDMKFMVCIYEIESFHLSSWAELCVSDTLFLNF